MATAEEVIAKYVQLRDEVATISKQQAEDLRPKRDAMQAIEAWLLNQLNTVGSDSFKTGAGTAYKTVASSVKLVDAGAFKGHVFAPALDQVYNYLKATGYDIQPVDFEAISRLLIEQARWDMVDFRAGKKGILEDAEHNDVLPPGVAVDYSTQVNVRRS